MKIEDCVATNKICPVCALSLSKMSIFQGETYYWCQNKKCESYDVLFWKNGEGKACVVHLQR
jgi:hypothetical protein